MQVLGESVTYRTKCRSCGAAIFFHTNGNGDAVFFDDLGPPWPVHWCYRAYVGGKEITDPSTYRARMVALYGTPYRVARSSRAAWTPQPLPWRRDLPAVEAPAPRPPRPEDIVRVDPAKNQRLRTVEVTGYLRDLHPHRPLSRLARPGTVLHQLLCGRVGASVVTQATVVTPDLMSYTFLLPLPELRVPKGAIIAVKLNRIAVIDRAFFVCRSLSHLSLEAR